MSGIEERAARVEQALRGRTAKWLAEAIGVAPSTALRYVRGQMPQADVALRIAEVLEVDVAWYVSGKGAGPSASAGAVVKVPQVDGRNQVVGSIEYPLGLVMGLAKDPSSVRCMIVAGEAMRPTVPRNAEVLFVPVDPDAVEDGRVYVVGIGGRLLVRRLRASPSGVWEAVCDNPSFRSEAPPEVSAADVVGEAVWMSCSL